MYRFIVSSAVKGPQSVRGLEYFIFYSKIYTEETREPNYDDWIYIFYSEEKKLGTNNSVDGGDKSFDVKL